MYNIVCVGRGIEEYTAVFIFNFIVFEITFMIASAKAKSDQNFLDYISGFPNLTLPHSHRACVHHTQLHVDIKT